MKPTVESPREKFERIKAEEQAPKSAAKTAPAAEPVKVKAPRKPRTAKKS